MAGVPVPRPDDELLLEVHAYAEPATGTGDVLVGYVPDPATRDGEGPYTGSRWHLPVPVERAGRWPRAEALQLMAEYNRVHKWRQKSARRWCRTVEPGA
jgi:hypothetical protein